jgi:hypothetical protein
VRRGTATAARVLRRGAPHDALRRSIARACAAAAAAAAAGATAQGR